MTDAATGLTAGSLRPDLPEARPPGSSAKTRARVAGELALAERQAFNEILTLGARATARRAA